MTKKKIYVGKDIKIIAFSGWASLDLNVNSLLFLKMRKRQRVSGTEIGTKLEAELLDEVSQSGSAPNTVRPLSFFVISSAVQSGRSVTELFLNIF